MYVLKHQYVSAWQVKKNKKWKALFTWKTLYTDHIFLFVVWLGVFFLEVLHAQSTMNSGLKYSRLISEYSLETKTKSFFLFQMLSIRMDNSSALEPWSG